MSSYPKDGRRLQSRGLRTAVLLWQNAKGRPRRRPPRGRSRAESAGSPFYCGTMPEMHLKLNSSLACVPALSVTTRVTCTSWLPVHVPPQLDDSYA
jgi:hypothetical protein